MTNKRNVLRHAGFKSIKVSFKTEIPDEFFDRYCIKHRINRNLAVAQLKSAAIKAADDEINTLLMEVQDVHKIYDNRE
tara:strand:+ start:16055 stop:16288 length:234 start_codon:yes stop_codon:yes gene_type:complete